MAQTNPNICVHMFCRGSKPTLRTFLAFLLNPFSVVLRRLDGERRPTARENLMRAPFRIVTAAVLLLAPTLLVAQQSLADPTRAAAGSGERLGASLRRPRRQRLR